MLDTCHKALAIINSSVCFMRARKSNGINKYKNRSRSFLVITHYQRLLKYIEPDVVHVLIDGKIVKSGSKELALELEEKGYSWLES